MPVTLNRTSTPQPGIPADFYAPRFAIEVDGEAVGPEVLAGVLEVKVDMELGPRPSHFQLILNNWDDRKAGFKNIESAGKPAKPLFDFGHRVLIRMGYANRLLPMVQGSITALAPEFPESGPRTLTVSGLDGMFDLIGEARTEKHRNKADWEIAQDLATRNGFLRTRVTKEGPKHDLVVQQGQDDASFLHMRAQRIGFDFYVRTDPDPETSGETLVFVKSEGCDGSKAPVYVFEWGKSLLRFSPVLDVSNQVGAVLVSSSTAASRKSLKASAGSGDIPSGNGRNGPAAIQLVHRGKQELVETVPVLSGEEAQRLAVSRLRERAYGYSTGSGQGIGLPELRPGDNVRIDGVGPRFGGCYQVTQVDHTINSSGYLTGFSVRRLHDGGNRS